MRSSLFTFFLLSTLTLILLVATAEYFYVRRNKLVKNITSMVGDHMHELRNIKSVDEGTMSMGLLRTAMNQTIDDKDDELTKSALETMLAVVIESKRKQFNLPMISKENTTKITEWAEKINSQSAPLAAKLLTHIYDSNLKHMEILIAQSYVNISETDPVLATSQMRLLSHYIDGAITAGLIVEPKLMMLTPNDKIIEKWLTNDDSKVKHAAQTLLNIYQEAKDIHSRS